MHYNDGEKAEGALRNSSSGPNKLLKVFVVLSFMQSFNTSLVSDLKLPVLMLINNYAVNEERSRSKKKYVLMVLAFA